MTSSLNLWLIPVLPLAGAAINGFLGKKSSRTAVSTYGLVFPGAAFAWALLGRVSFFVQPIFPTRNTLPLDSLGTASAPISLYISINFRWSCCWWLPASAS